MPKCIGHNASGGPCGKDAIAGGKVCTTHGGMAPKVKAKAAVRAEVMRWGLGDVAVDPGEVLLRLVSQSAARVEAYARLLEDAYQAAERLKVAHEAHRLIAVTAPDGEDSAEAAAIQQARLELDRIFNAGGVAALIGHQYDATKDGTLYAASEQIRGLADLEAQERDRCAGFAAKAIAAGLAERQVRLAEQQGALIAELIRKVIDDPDLGLTAQQRRSAGQIAARHLRLAS